MSKNIVVVGATGGIGKSIADYLNQNKFNLYLTGNSNDKLEYLRGKFPLAKIFKMNIAEEIEVKKVVKDFPKIDGLVVASGIQHFMTAKFIKKEIALKMMQINFWGPVFLIQSLLKAGKLNDFCSIIFISSVSAQLGVKGQSIYAATKAALNGYMRSLANELTARRMRVNSISPGIIKTELVEKMMQNLDSATMDTDQNRYPFGFGETHSLNGLVCFLLSDSSRWMTGQDIIIDGGLTLY